VLLALFDWQATPGRIDLEERELDCVATEHWGLTPCGGRLRTRHLGLGIIGAPTGLLPCIDSIPGAPPPLVPSVGEDRACFTVFLELPRGRDAARRRPAISPI
jgi:hypothetical protein